MEGDEIGAYREKGRADRESGLDTKLSQPGSVGALD
jgi:hypothetical protein